MLRIIEGSGQMDVLDDDAEKKLLSYVAYMEKGIENDETGVVTVSKKDFCTLCRAAAMVYEAQKWRQREEKLLHLICEKGFGFLPREMQEHLEYWKKAKQSEAQFSEELQKRLKKWETRQAVNT